MKKVMPQEIEVWYLIPSLRREIAKILINKNNLSQKKAAKILGMTEAAISQYLSNKRGNEIRFTKEEVKDIEKSASKIAKNPDKSTEIIYTLSKSFKGHDCVCNAHRKHDPSISKNCRMCLNLE